jgi:hypothetical protein
MSITRNVTGHIQCTWHCHLDNHYPHYSPSVAHLAHCPLLVTSIGRAILIKLAGRTVLVLLVVLGCGLVLVLVTIAGGAVLGLLIMTVGEAILGPLIITIGEAVLGPLAISTHPVHDLHILRAGLLSSCIDMISLAFMLLAIWQHAYSLLVPLRARPLLVPLRACPLLVPLHARPSLAPLRARHLTHPHLV